MYLCLHDWKHANDHLAQITFYEQTFSNPFLLTAIQSFAFLSLSIVSAFAGVFLNIYHFWQSHLAQISSKQYRKILIAEVQYLKIFFFSYHL